MAGRKDLGKESSSNRPDDENGIQMERKESAVAELRRLASKEQIPSSPPDADADNRASAGPAAAAALLGNQKPSGLLHADIKNFVEKEYVKSSALKELVRHIVFLIIFIAALMLNRSAYESYLMNQSLNAAFITQQIANTLQPFPTTFQTLGSPQQWAQWLLNIVGGTLDNNQNYNGDPLTPFQMNYVQFSNRILGGVRVRQLRAAVNQDCTLAHQLNNLSEIPGKCLSWNYGTNNMDTSPFGPINPETGKPKFTYQTESQCGSVGQFGNMINYLEGGGYVVDFPLALHDNGSTFSEAIGTLINDTFIDVQTRALIVTMNFANLDLESRMSVMYFIAEIPGNGLIFPSAVLKTFRLNLYVTGLDYFRMVLEIFIFLLIWYSWYTELNEMYSNFKAGKIKKYFYNFWNIVELTDLILYFTVIVLYLKYIGSSGRYAVKLDSRYYFPELEQIAASAIVFYNLAAVNVIISTFRTFKYLRLNNRLYVLWKALRHAGADLVGFLFIFLILIFGFVFMGWVAFGQDIQGYNNFSNSFGTCWNFLLGNPPDYNAMSASNRILGPFFFCSIHHIHFLHFGKHVHRYFEQFIWSSFRQRRQCKVIRNP